MSETEYRRSSKSVDLNPFDNPGIGRVDDRQESFGDNAILDDE